MDEQDSTWHESYIAFMLRLWRTGSQSGNPLWRASLEDPVTGTRLAFSDINALFAFLSDRTCSRVVTSEPEAADDTTGTLSADESTPL